MAEVDRQSAENWNIPVRQDAGFCGQRNKIEVFAQKELHPDLPLARVSAHSQPARPPPMIAILAFVIKISPNNRSLQSNLLTALAVIFKITAMFFANIKFWFSEKAKAAAEACVFSGLALLFFFLLFYRSCRHKYLALG